MKGNATLCSLCLGQFLVARFESPWVVLDATVDLFSSALEGAFLTFYPLLSDSPVERTRHGPLLITIAPHRQVSRQA